MMGRNGGKAPAQVARPPGLRMDAHGQRQGESMTAVPASDNWQLGNVYEGYVGRWSRKVAPEFLSWIDVPPGRRWLDVGCGTGALCGAILDRASPASVSGVEPSEGFLA